MDDPLVLPRAAAIRGPARPLGWFARAWIRSAEELAHDERDLAPARALARSGRFGSVVVIPGMASAVLDPGKTPGALAQIRVERLGEADWESFGRELVRESGFLAALESGDLPTELVEHADAVGVELLPGTAEFETGCSCSAWTQPCGHVLGLLMLLGPMIDQDPYILFLLRGRTRSQLTAVEPRLESTEEADDAARRAAEILRLSVAAPGGHGLADSAVAAYDEAVGRLV